MISIARKLPSVEHSIQTQKTFKETLAQLQQYPPFAELMRSVYQRAGKKIQLSLSKTPLTNGAHYDSSRHEITLNLSQLRSREDTIVALVFEVHNALLVPEFIARENKDIIKALGKEVFVSNREQMEYGVAQKTHQFVLKMINDGKLSKNARFAEIPRTFKEYYLIQQLAGHSQAIAQQFDREFEAEVPFTPYKGTWPVLLNSDRQKQILRGFMYLLQKRNSEVGLAYYRSRLELQARNRDPDALRAVINMQYVLLCRKNSLDNF